MPGNVILITGAHGFVGRHAARLFASNGWSVIGIGNGNWAPSEWREWGLSEWHNLIVDFDSLAAHGSEPDLLLHAAGGGSVGFSLKHPALDFHRTVETTLSALEYIRVRSPKTRIIFPSSTAVYGSVPKGRIAETSPLHPASPYGSHKQAAEQLCESYAVHFGVRISVLRFFSIYGNGLTKQLLWDICNQFNSGPETITLHGTGDEIRDLIHIEDAVRLMIPAADRANDRFWPINGGTGTGTTVREIADAIRSAYDPARKIQFSGSVRDGDPLYFQADTARAESLGWKPRHEWRQGVAEYVAWYRSAFGNR